MYSAVEDSIFRASKQPLMPVPAGTVRLMASILSIRPFRSHQLSVSSGSYAKTGVTKLEFRNSSQGASRQAQP